MHLAEGILDLLSPRDPYYLFNTGNVSYSPPFLGDTGTIFLMQGRSLLLG